MSDAQARERPSWARLGAELRHLRRRAGFSQEDLAAVLEVSKSTVNRIETGGVNGGSPPSIRDVMAWAAKCEVANPDLAVLRALGDAALDEHRPYKDWGTLGSIQRGVLADETTARTLRNFDPWGIPGLLQTSDYARAILAMTDPRRGGEEVAEALAVRMDRRPVLYQPGRRFEFLVTEEGLRRRPASAGVQQFQLHQLAEEISQEPVTFRIIPSGTPMMASLGTGFVLYEDRVEDSAPFVAIELPLERAELNNPADVAFFQARFEALSEGAISGDDAVEFVHEVARSLRPPEGE